MTMEETNGDPLIRACGELFELLLQVCGNQKGAEELWKKAFWFGFDGRNPVVIPEGSAAQFAGWIYGATSLMTVLIENDLFK